MNLCIGEVPLMSEAGIFLINGCERVVINQIIRSPGVYYTEVCKKGVILYRATVIPTKGSWLRFGIDESKQITVCMDQMEDTEIMNCLRVFNLPLNEMLNSFKYPFFFIRHLKMHYKKYATYEREQFSEFFTKQMFNPQLYTQLLMV
jgi:DNA-directed RNA polymerase subunit beta